VRARLKHTHVGEWPSITLVNDALQLLVIPELGGKIVSLKSRRTGREWLWSNPHIPHAKPSHDALNFGMYDSGGWDEIFPTIDPCSVPDTAWGERQLTDHGELWYQPWQVDAARITENRSAELKLVVDDMDLPFRFGRTLTLNGNRGSLRVHYEVLNRSELPLPFIWAAHPLFAIEPGDAIILPPSTIVSSTGNVGLSLAGDSLPFAWPQLKLATGEVIDVNRIPDHSAGFAIKLFAENVTPPTVEIADHTRLERLQISFSSPISHCGLWLNYGAWSGASTKNYFNIGVEPTTSPCDSLEMACGKKLAVAIQPYSEKRWQLNLSIR